MTALSTLAMSDIKNTKNEKAEEFIAKNRVILSKEASIGHGESIDTLAELLSIGDVERFSLFLQANYKQIDTILRADVAEKFKSMSEAKMQVTLN